MLHKNISIRQIVNYIDSGRLFFIRPFIKNIDEKFTIKQFNSIYADKYVGSISLFECSKTFINMNEDNLKLFKINRFVSINKDIEQELQPIISDYQSYYLLESGEKLITALYSAQKGAFVFGEKKKELFVYLNNETHPKFAFLSSDESYELKDKIFKVKDIFKFDDESDMAYYVYSTYSKNKLTFFKILFKLYRAFNTKYESSIFVFEYSHFKGA